MKAQFSGPENTQNVLETGTIMTEGVNYYRDCIISTAVAKFMV